MSSYTTATRLENRYGTRRLAELTDDELGAVIDTTLLAQIITDASARVDLRLGAAGWSLPVTTSSHPWVQTVTETLVLYMLYERRGRIPAQVRTEYEAAIGMLDKIATQELPIIESTDLDIESATDIANRFNLDDQEGL